MALPLLRLGYVGGLLYQLFEGTHVRVVREVCDAAVQVQTELIPLGGIIYPEAVVNAPLF